MKLRAFEKLYKELFYIPKHEKLSDKVFWCRMAISLFTILACTAVMAASTFALFHSEVSTDHSTIVGAYYSVTVNSAENGTYICPLSFEDKHTFEIKADGTATTGYCKIQVGEQVYYTEQIFKGSSLILTVQAAEGTPIIFTPQLGTSYYLNVGTCGNDIIHSTTPYATYIVEETATPNTISTYYNVSVDDIMLYNGITELTVGSELKIPGVSPSTPSYVAPVLEPSAGTDEDRGNVPSDENNYPPAVDDAVADGDIGADDQPTIESPVQEPVGDNITSDEIITEEQQIEEEP